jgi:hypothetical protein
MPFANGWFVGSATKVPADSDIEATLMSCDYDRASPGRSASCRAGR